MDKPLRASGCLLFKGRWIGHTRRTSPATSPTMEWSSDVVMRLIEWLLAWRAQARADEIRCKHDGTPPYCFQCAQIRFPPG